MCMSTLQMIIDFYFHFCSQFRLIQFYFNFGLKIIYRWALNTTIRQRIPVIYDSIPKDKLS